MNLLLVRHAVTRETGKRLSGRLPGIPLSPEGVAAAQAVAENLTSQNIAAVYTSPIERCQETAGILAQPHGHRVRPRQQLVEVEYGTWSGRTLRSLYRLRAWKDLMVDPAGFRFPEGETLEEVRRRSVRFLSSMAKTYTDETVLAVSHGDVIRAIVTHCLNESVDAIHRLHVAPLGITAIALAAGHPPTVSVVNAPRL